jgi:kumamolisin
MPAEQGRAIIVGSERAAVLGAKSIGPVQADERFEVTVRVRRRTALGALAAGGFNADLMPSKRRYIARELYAEQHGADPADLARVEAFAKSQGLVVVASSPARRSVFLSGTAALFSAAFGTAIEQHEYEGGTYRGRTGPLTVPSELAPIVDGVFGIDNRPIARPHFQVQLAAAGTVANATGGTFTPPQLATLYNFPTGVDGSGQCIAIVELGGGYRPGDIKAYFQKLGLTVPDVKTIRVDGGNNSPSNPNSADGEVMLDIEVAAAIAPKALIAVYFAPNTDKGFLDAITMATHDTVNKPSVISISWGSAEVNWTAQAMNSFDQAFQTAAALGVTVCCAAGDNGSGDGESDGKAHVDFPASSPYALGCGGTRLTGSGTSIASETVWNDNSASSATGGGVSDFFAVPAYQGAAGVPVSANPSKNAGRGVPDVAGDADPQSGYVVRVDGVQSVIGGTSAVAPLWAGLIVLMNQKLGHPVGYLNPLIYGSLVGRGCFHDITSGNNGAYASRSGWNPCTGWGSPNGTLLLQALSG